MLAIETHQLTRLFGKRAAVSHLNLQVPTGSVYGFLGPNGAGKTTTIRLLLGLIRPTAGNVKLFGGSLKQHSIALLRRVGALVETPSLYPHLTGYENLEVMRRMSGAPREQIERALQIVNLTADAGRLVREYSLGMRQRLGLAVALLNQPDLLILDEPTNGLDPAGIREMRALIRTLANEQGLTIFLSSHLLNEVEQTATHLGVIQDGQLKFQGSLADLQSQRQRFVTVQVDRMNEATQLLAQANWLLEANADQTYLKINAQLPAEAATINRLLVEAGLQVFHLKLEQPSLEDSFFSLTHERIMAE